MKIAVCSDLHLEFGDLLLQNKENADVLILSGDICVAKELLPQDSLKGLVFRNFFKRVSTEFKQVVWVAGNHEHYHGKLHKTFQNCKEFANSLGNVHYLEQESVVIDGVKFIGATMWTNCNNGDHLTMYHLKQMMNDFRTITMKNPNGDYFKFTPEQMFNIHVRTMQFFKESLKNNREQDQLPVVMVTHHAPSRLSTHPYYQDDTIMNGGYSSDLLEFIVDNPEIKLWTHGHTHHPFDYLVDDTRVVCNPRGYMGYEDSADQFQLKLVEV